MYCPMRYVIVRMDIWGSLSQIANWMLAVIVKVALDNTLLSDCYILPIMILSVQKPVQ
jgi:hypothetical protein